MCTISRTTCGKRSTVHRRLEFLCEREKIRTQTNFSLRFRYHQIRIAGNPSNYCLHFAQFTRVFHSIQFESTLTDTHCSLYNQNSQVPSVEMLRLCNNQNSMGKKIFIFFSFNFDYFVLFLSPFNTIQHKFQIPFWRNENGVFRTRRRQLMLRNSVLGLDLCETQTAVDAF